MKKWDFEDVREVLHGFFYAFVFLLFSIISVFVFAIAITAPCEKLIKAFLCVFATLFFFFSIWNIIVEIRDGILHMKWYFQGSEKCPKWLKEKKND